MNTRKFNSLAIPMKKIWVLLFAILLSFLQWVYALVAPSSLEVTQVTGSSVTLDWDVDANAEWYYVYYGTKSASGSTYESEWVDLIDGSETSVDNLKPETKYFFAVTSVDSDGNESDFSKEVSYTTLKTWESKNVSKFKILSVSVIDTETLEFQFSSQLDSSGSAVNEFAIQNKSNLKQLPVDISSVNEADPSKVLVVLGESLTPETSYKVTVLDMRDSAWNSIEAGINAFINFETPTFKSKAPVKIENTEVIEEDNTAVTPPSQNTQNEASSPNEENTTEVDSNPSATINKWNAGQTISQADIDSNTLSTAAESEALPQTWPGQWILLIIAFLFVGAIYFINTRRRSV